MPTRQNQENQRKVMEERHDEIQTCPEAVVRKRYLTVLGELFRLWMRRKELRSELLDNSEEASPENLILDEVMGKMRSPGKKKKQEKEDNSLPRDLGRVEKKIARAESGLRKIAREAERDGLALPLEELVKKYQLSPAEKNIVVILFMSDLCERPKTSGIEILDLLFSNKVEILSHRHLFYAESKLRKNKVIIQDRLLSSTLQADYRLSEKTIRALLGEEMSPEEEKDYDEDVFQGRGKSKGRLLEIITPKVSWERVVLPQDHRQQIEEALYQLKAEKIIFEDWGLGQTLSYGREIAMLFSGPPGTGKTMAAEAIAHKLGKDMGIVRFDQIQNCWVGETEKNVVKVFREAEECGCVLLFDECDGLFNRRISAQRAVDMMENRSTNLLLQQIERYSGLVILTTNHPVDLDEALERRISLRLTFEVPNVEGRARIWGSFFSQKSPLAPGVDFEALAREFNFPGGNIKNAVLKAVRKCAFESQTGERSLITQKMLRDAARDELMSRWEGTKRKIGF